MKLPVLSGTDVVKLLSKAGFSFLSQEGSHVILLNEVGGKKLKPVVPMHKEIFAGTLVSIIKQAGMSRNEFMELYEKYG